MDEAESSKWEVLPYSKIYDRFVERQMSCTQSVETQNFLLPIWKLRSSFNDALRPVEENMIDSMLGSKMLLATNAIKGWFLFCCWSTKNVKFTNDSRFPFLYL